MRFIRLCSCGLTVLAFACSAFGLQARHELCVIETTPPTVVEVDTQQGKVVEKIPVEKNPTYAVAGSSGRFLYVLHDQRSLMGLGALKPARVSIVDLKNPRVDRVIQFKTGINGIQLSRDDRTLFCFAKGNNWRFNGHWKPQDDAYITAIDTTSQEVKNVYRISTPASYLVMTRDGSRLLPSPSASSACILERNTSASK